MEKVLSKKLYENLEACFRSKEVKQKMVGMKKEERRSCWEQNGAEFILRNKDVQQHCSVRC